MPDSDPPRRHARPFVLAGQKTRALHFTTGETQSRMNLRQPDALMLAYTRTMMGFLLLKPAPDSLAMIGLGGGSLAKFCHRHLPRTVIRVLEINPHVIALREDFHIPADDSRFSVIEGDGAEFVRHPPQAFDVLMVDGYDKRGLPAPLCSQDFYDDCRGTLAAGGVLVVNLHMEHPDHAAHLARIHHSFDGAVLVVDDDKEGNAVVFAEKGGLPARVQAGLPRRPAGMGEDAWHSLQESFALMLAAAARYGA
jgi:spermidine synthase